MSSGSVHQHCQKSQEVKQISFIVQYIPCLLLRSVVQNCRYRIYNDMILKLVLVKEACFCKMSILLLFLNNISTEFGPYFLSKKKKHFKKDIKHEMIHLLRVGRYSGTSIRIIMCQDMCNGKERTIHPKRELNRGASRFKIQHSTE